VVCPGERITVQEALRTYTIMAARHVFMEDRIGSLEPGKYPDMVVWDRDLYAVPTAELKEIVVEKTSSRGSSSTRRDSFMGLGQ
jgi:predicted amidohydrolase YtcJ